MNQNIIWTAVAAVVLAIASFVLAFVNPNLGTVTALSALTCAVLSTRE